MVNRVTRMVTIGAVAMGLALVLARIDFSASAVDSTPPVNAATSQFTPGNVEGGSLVNVAPVDTAIRFFESRVAANPNSYIDLTHLASQHLRAAKDLGYSENIGLAINAAARALEINPDYPVAAVAYANALATNHRFDEAIAAVADVPQSSKSRANALAIIGDSHLALGEYESAERFYGELASVSPGPAALSRLAHLEFLNGETESALNLARLAAEGAQASGVTPHQMSWHLAAIGEFYLAEGEAATALDHFQKALELAPDHIFALAGTAHSQWMSGDLAGSAETYERALGQVPSDTGIMVELADVYRALGRTEEADALVAMAIHELNDPLSEPQLVRRELAQLLADNGINLDLAVRLARDEVLERKDVYAYDTLAWVLYRSGEYDLARDAAEKAMALKTRDASIYYHAGLIYSALGETNAAIDALEKVQEINPNFSLSEASNASSGPQRKAFSIPR